MTISFCSSTRARLSFTCAVLIAFLSLCVSCVPVYLYFVACREDRDGNFPIVDRLVAYAQALGFDGCAVLCCAVLCCAVLCCAVCCLLFSCSITFDCHSESCGNLLSFVCAGLISDSSFVSIVVCVLFGCLSPLALNFSVTMTGGL